MLYNFKEIKKKSKDSINKNYVMTVLVCLFGVLFLSLYTGTSSVWIEGFERVQNYFDNGHLMTNAEIDYIDSGLYNKTIDYNELYEKTDQELRDLGYNDSAIRYIHSLDPDFEDKNLLSNRLKVRDGFAKPLLNFASNEFKTFVANIGDVLSSLLSDGIINENAWKAIVAMIVITVYRFGFDNVVTVGYARYFLENSKYRKTRFSRIFTFIFHDYFNVFKVMLRVTIYQILWLPTIIGAIIKHYSYRLVPYIVAEDANVSSKEAIRLSRMLMKGNKWRAFMLDISFFPWHILNSISFGLLGVFFLNPYTESASAEFYKDIIMRKKEEEFYKNYLGERKFADEKLYIEEDKDYYDGTAPSDYSFALPNYKPLSLALLFFVFAIIGWGLEVTMFLFKTHTFVNRGTLIGPWLPIYGAGCVLILIVFTKTRFKKNINNPIILFLSIMLLCGVLEYFTSWMLEVTTGLKYWDYAGHFLNINGRICFENLCEFGLGGLLCIYLCAPNLNKVIEKTDKRIIKSIVAVLAVVFIIDNIYVRINPRTGYGITDSILDEEGNILDAEGNIVK